MFAGSPIWERGRKGRKVSARSMFEGRDDDSLAPAPAAEPRSFREQRVQDERVRDEALMAGGAAGVAASTPSAAPVEDEAPFVAPARTTTVRRNRSMAPAAAAVGLIALAALAAVGWYATRPNDLAATPGGPAATSIASTPVSGANSVAANTPPASSVAPAAAPAASTTTTTTQSHRTVVAQAHTAAPPAVRHRATSRAVGASPEQPVTPQTATGAGVNTAATAPAGVGANQTSAGVAPSTPSTAAPPPAAGSTSPPVTTTPQTPAPSTTTPDMTSPGTSTPQSAPQTSGSPQ